MRLCDFGLKNDTMKYRYELVILSSTQVLKHKKVIHWIFEKHYSKEEKKQ